MAQAVLRARLTDYPFFQGLAPAYLRFLSAQARPRRLRPDDVLFREHTHADRFYLLLAGRVTVEVPAISGPVLDVQTLQAGEILGWSWLIPPYRWRFQGRAAGPAELLEFDGVAVREYCRQDAAFGYELLQRFAGLMSERLEAARLKMMEEWNPAGFA